MADSRVAVLLQPQGRDCCLENGKLTAVATLSLCYLLSSRSGLLFAIPPPKLFLPQSVAHDIISGKSHHFRSLSLIFHYDQSRNGSPQRKAPGDSGSL